MKFLSWLAERNQRDATKSPKTKSNLELHIRASKKNAHNTACGRAGPMSSDGRPKRSNRGKSNRDEIGRSERDE